MHITPDQYPFAYAQMETVAYQQNAPAILLLVAEDVDALAACKILTSTFKSTSKRYILERVQGRDSIAQLQDRLLFSSEIKIIIFIECGATEDITTYLSLTVDRRVFIIDSHRPLNLDNIFNSTQVVFLDDGEVEKLDDERDAYRKIQEINLELEDMDDIDDDDDLDDNDSDSEDDERNERWARRKRKEKLLNIRNECISIIDTYYASNSNGTSSAQVAHSLVKSAKVNQPNHTWLEIVGLTSQYLNERISNTTYTEFAADLTDKVRAGAGQISKSTISPSEEMRIMLYRHWNLYESMTYSTYVSTRLCIWREKGRRKFEHLLTTMGISLEQAKQSYTHMAPEIRANLTERLEEYAANYELGDIVYPSFTKSLDSQGAISASDIVYGCNALLQRGAGWENANDEASRDASWFDAFDALDNMENLERGIAEAIKLQKLVVRQGISMMEKRIVSDRNGFRWAAIRDTPDLEFFLHPLMLSNLALFLLRALKVTKRKDMPVVLTVLDSRIEKFLVLGLNSPSSVDGVPRNKFGSHFRRIADLLNVETSLATFEDRLIYLDKKELIGFVDTLDKDLITIPD